MKRKTFPCGRILIAVSPHGWSSYVSGYDRPRSRSFLTRVSIAFDISRGVYAFVMRLWLAALLILTGSEVSQWTPAPSDGVSLRLLDGPGPPRGGFCFFCDGGGGAG